MTTTLSKTGLQTACSLNALSFSHFKKADHFINDDLLVPSEDLRTNPEQPWLSQKSTRDSHY